MSIGTASNTSPLPISLPPLAGDIRFEEFLDLVEDGKKADLLDGVIYMASPDNTVANDLTVWLTTVLDAYIVAKDLGKLNVLRVAYRLQDNRGPEPDLAFIRKGRESLRRRGFVDGPPDLAIEIVSPDSTQRDYIAKRSQYEQAGVGEYWILDPDHGRATFLRLENGKFVEIEPERHLYRSPTLAGLELDIRWLTTDERPQPFQLLQKLLGG